MLGHGIRKSNTCFKAIFLAWAPIPATRGDGDRDNIKARVNTCLVDLVNAFDTLPTRPKLS